MSKTLKDNPYAKIRKPIPPHGYEIPSKVEYNRSKAKEEIKEIIEEAINDSDESIQRLILALR